MEYICLAIPEDSIKSSKQCGQIRYYRLPFGLSLETFFAQSQECPLDAATDPDSQTIGAIYGQSSSNHLHALYAAQMGDVPPSISCGCQRIRWQYVLCTLGNQHMALRSGSEVRGGDTAAVFPRLMRSRFAFADTEPFHLALEVHPSVESGLVRRDTGYFVTLDGKITTDCSQATIFWLDRDAQLVAGNANPPAIYATSPGIYSQQFVSSIYPSITRSSWVVSSDGFMTWTNETFLNGAAVTCVKQDGSVQLYFLIAPPSTCTLLRFRKPTSESKAASAPRHGTHVR